MLLDRPKPLLKLYGMVDATMPKRTVPKIPQPSKIETKEILNLNIPMVSIRPTEIMSGFTYGLSKCFLRVMPAIEIKKTSMRVK